LRDLPFAIGDDGTIAFSFPATGDAVDVLRSDDGPPLVTLRAPDHPPLAARINLGRDDERRRLVGDLNGRAEEAAGELVLVAQALAKMNLAGILDPPAARPTPSCVSPHPPAFLSPHALHGLAGDIVRAIEPHTEADPAALLSNVLVMFGSAAGRGPFTRVGDTRHGVNLNVIQVGQSSKGRKGTAQAGPRRLLRDADQVWAETRVLSGLSSGEGLIWAVRDAIEKTEPIKEKGQITGYQNVVVDPGVQDKRLLVVEEEFASTLKVAGREGNTLSAVMRQAWDGQDLRVLTKNTPAVATAPHVAIVGHITKDELLRHLDSTEAANGFANRFLWVWVQRSKILPEGGTAAETVLQDLARRIGGALTFARRVGEVRRNDEARAAWTDVYGDLSAGKPGLFGAVTSRAEAQVLRLSLLYALLDESRHIRADHLVAALAFWDYCEASARFVFGDATGDPVADRILAALRVNGPMVQNDVVELFGRHVASARLGRAQEILVAAGLVRSAREETGGRPRTIWEAA
jgi:hypothetical protein